MAPLVSEGNWKWVLPWVDPPELLVLTGVPAEGVVLNGELGTPPFTGEKEKGELGTRVLVGVVGTAVLRAGAGAAAWERF